MHIEFLCFHNSFISLSHPKLSMVFPNVMRQANGFRILGSETMIDDSRRSIFRAM